MAARIPRPPLVRQITTVSHPLRFRFLPTVHRSYASIPKLQPITTKNADGQLTLEKPDRFRPPSHPSRPPKDTQPRNFPGPPLSAAELAAQKTKRYPNMMPPEGTLLFRVLNNRVLHACIAFGILILLALYTFVADFQRNNLFPSLLPPASLLYSGHPLEYLAQYARVYKMHLYADSARAAEQRAKQIEDAQKRKEYLRQHGKIELLFGWLGEDESEEEPVWERPRAAKGVLRANEERRRRERERAVRDGDGQEPTRRDGDGGEQEAGIR